MWAPLAAKYDISETALLCGFADALPVARARLGAHLANLPSAGAATRLAIFPGGNSFQFLPAEFVRHLLQMLGETEYCCYFSPHDDLIPIFQAAGLKCATTNGMDELLTVLRGCQVCVTADSFVSHLAQIVCREHVALLSRDLPQHVMHPFCRSSVVYEHVECAPCVYLERPKYARCAAGRETCKVFDLKSYRGEAVRQIGKALANSNTDF